MFFLKKNCLHLTHKTLLHDPMTRKTDDGGCDLFRRTATQSDFALNDRSATQAGQEGNGPFLTQNWCKDALKTLQPDTPLSWGVPERGTDPSLLTPRELGPADTVSSQTGGQDTQTHH